MGVRYGVGEAARGGSRGWSAYATVRVEACVCQEAWLEREVFAGLRVCGFPPGPLPRATPPRQGAKAAAASRNHTRQTRQPAHPALRWLGRIHIWSPWLHTSIHHPLPRFLAEAIRPCLRHHAMHHSLFRQRWLAK